MNRNDLGNMMHDIAGDCACAEGSALRVSAIAYENGEAPLTREQENAMVEIKRSAANLRDEVNEFFYGFKS